MSKEGLFAFTGLWERRKDPGTGEIVRTCTIITGQPNELVPPIHDRMPVILPPETWPTWLGEREVCREELLDLLQPCPAERMRTYRIGPRVNNVRNDEAALLQPA